MRDSLVKVLQGLVRERETLRESERQLAKREQQMLESFRQLLPKMGYKLVASTGAGRSAARRLGPGKPKRIPCPQCDRMFAHPLPLARHMSATHGVKGKRVPKKAGRKVAAKKGG
jgi:uncharacterized C2H2 Zn-finger protein